MNNRRAFQSLVIICLGSGWALAAATQPVPASAQLSFDISSSPNAVVLQLREDVGIRDADDTPLVRIYGDGRVAVHFPDYMRRAGDYELRLPEDTLQELMQAAAGSILSFDSAVTESRVRALETAERNDGVVVRVSHRTTTILEVRYEQYRPAGAAVDIRDGVKRVAWTGLVSDAERFRDVTALRDLAGIRRQVRALADHPDLEAVAPR